MSGRDLSMQSTFGRWSKLLRGPFGDLCLIDRESTLRCLRYRIRAPAAERQRHEYTAGCPLLVGMCCRTRGLVVCRCPGACRLSHRGGPAASNAWHQRSTPVDAYAAHSEVRGGPRQMNLASRLRFSIQAQSLLGGARRQRASALRTALTMWETEACGSLGGFCTWHS